jgi:hypothetical protein
MTTSEIIESISKAFATYDVRESWVITVDNDGEACEYCETLGQVVEVMISGRTVENEADELSVECCGDCVKRIVAEHHSPQHPVRLEWSATQRYAAPDDRMHGPDCECVHPDAV